MCILSGSLQPTLPHLWVTRGKRTTPVVVVIAIIPVPNRANYSLASHLDHPPSLSSLLSSLSEPPCNLSKTITPNPPCFARGYHRRALLGGASEGCSVTKRHPLEPIKKAPPVLGKHLGVLHPLLRPVLVPPRYVILCVLEVCELVAETFLDEDRPVVLVDNRFFVLLVASCEQQHLRGSESSRATYLDNCLDNLLSLARLHQPLRLGP